MIWHDPDIPAAKCTFAGDGDAPSSARISQMTLAQVQAYRCDQNPDRGAFPDQNANPTALAGDNYQILSLAQLFDFVETYADSPEKSDAQRQNARRRAIQHRNQAQSRRPQRHQRRLGWTRTPAPSSASWSEMIESRKLVERVIVQSFVHESLWGVQR